MAIPYRKHLMIKRMTTPLTSLLKMICQPHVPDHPSIVLVVVLKNIKLQIILFIGKPEWMRYYVNLSIGGKVKDTTAQEGGEKELKGNDSNYCDHVVDVFNPFLLVWYTQIFIITSTFAYEGYTLYSKLAIIEPCLFFSSFFGFGYLLAFGVDFSTTEYRNMNDNDDSKTNGITQEEMVEKYHIYQDDSDEENDNSDKSSLDGAQGDGDGLSLFDDISLAGEPVSEEALMRDKEVMANWQHLMTRSWRAAPTDDDNEHQHLYHEPYPALGNDGLSSQLHVADDGASMLSMASRFNEDDDEDEDGEDDDDDDLESTTEEDLEQLWARYEQFKQDEELAEKLQQEEQVRGLKMKQHGDGQNPFLQGHGQG
ncbi:hypothetical protein BCR42DRAFT_57054 [Absidia repens]|uniref:Uncharacterized protein n=1 Tax=Absidia repens TaxID=90262 RepID=A0A1X2IDX0_9FUNG|nr:hypothetical protein BCR42DRAFT_57054 [Absidia repens]